MQKIFIKIIKPLLFILLITTTLVFNLGITVTQKAIINEFEKEKNNSINNQDVQDIKETYCVGKVIKVISDVDEELPGGNKQRAQQLLLKIISGPDKNKERVTLNLIPDNPAFAIVGEIDREYLITKIENLSTGNEDYFVVDYYREHFIWILFGLFFAILILISGIKGIRTIISLICTIALVAFLLIPSINKGINPLLSAILISILATGITMLLVAGANAKSLASTLGTGIGVAISGIIATFVIKAAPLSGLASSEAMILWGNQFYQINFKGLLAASMIVACLGAIMDVAISIASSIQEIKTANPKYSMKELFKSGMNVGKDIIGTMTNTLVLAYAGMALPLLLLVSYEQNASKFLNLELVVSEITAAMAGSTGLIIAVPATAIIMSWLLTKKKVI